MTMDNFTRDGKEDGFADLAAEVEVHPAVNAGPGSDNSANKRKQIAIVVYPGMTALDVVGPFELLRTLPDSEVRFVWHQPGPVMTDSRTLILGATHSFDETPRPDIVLVGGSLLATMRTSIDEQLLEWLRRVHPTTMWTVSVCSGSVILAAAGLLAGRRATSHWAALPMLKAYGARPDKDQRMVVDGKIVTGAGVSAGLDLGLWLLNEVEGQRHAEAAQLVIEYDPQPLFDSGHLSKASARTKADAVVLGNQLFSGRDRFGEAIAVGKAVWTTALDRVRGRTRRRTRISTPR
ncbi:DJ-1/PfpI family protein [Mycobacteroides chelonae]|uniref:DJ-1/PfpI family protein n=1 Tax=Mycobacteroides chelonae TaxID=1774 RepID=UPI000AAB3846|nr:DJ-1/PfpI family protein [Mycobacteroides chelonae]